MKRVASLLTLGLLAATPAVADIDVRFIEGAPKDRFTFTNSGACALENARIELDLSGSKAGLIFDITAAGAGVEVFQPLEFISGGDTLATRPTLTDGDTALTLVVQSLPVGGVIGFTVDVDDTMGAREITVSGAEIAGAQLSLTSGEGSSAAQFSDKARATLAVGGCSS